ncbi:MAG: ATP phosphoribosyltransferase [Armatimonadota bacterium]
MPTDQTLRLALPSGSLQEATLTMFGKAGFSITVPRRGYSPAVDDPEIEARLLRAQEIPRYVAAGSLDVGLTGKDWIAETDSDVVEVAPLVYSKQGLRPFRWVLAVPEDSDLNSAQDLAGKRVATEVVNLTRRFFADKGVEAEIEYSWGATEAKVPELADAVVEGTETGASLRANKLRIIETLMESTTMLIASHQAWGDQWKRAKIESLALLLQGALAAEEKVGLKMNVPADRLAGVLESLPALRNPTVSKLAEEGWVAVETIIDEAIVRQIIPTLKAAGATGIIEYPLNKVIP